MIKKRYQERIFKKLIKRILLRIALMPLKLISRI